MPCLTINGQAVTVSPGTTLLEAARQVGVAIPSLCYLKGMPHFTSCMVCVVQDRTSGKLLPACSAPAAEGMVIETEAPEALHVRAGSLNLLMSEHAGDCEAPCTTTCPAHLNIPRMIRQIASGKMEEALDTLHESIPMPAVMGRICPAPCEKACRRGRLDAPLSICLLERFAGDQLAHAGRTLSKAPSTQKRVTIIGAGPAGLSAAYYLARAGHACTVFDDHAEAGGQLRYGVPEYALPVAVLDREIRRIHALGVEFRMKTRAGVDVTLQALKLECDAIVLALGKSGPDALALWGVASGPRGIQVDESTFRTTDGKLFAGGEVVQPGHLAIRAMAHGKAIACSVDQLLRGGAVTGPPRRFESRLGKITETEGRELLKEAASGARTLPPDGPGTGFPRDEAVQESQRCMHCDCRKADDCRLRDAMQGHLDGPLHVPAEGRKPLTRNVTHPDVMFEPGKCIQCGICVSITAQAGETPGLAFLGRGFEAVVGVPFGESLEAALGRSASQCVKECPTGALAWRV
jgi:ferredoxin